MAFQKHSVEMRAITREVAQQFATMAAFVGERRLKASRVAGLRQLAENGLFVSPSWDVVLDINNPEAGTLRANGRHSSTMLGDLTVEDWARIFPNGLSATVTTWHSDDINADAMPLFMIFDAPPSVRTNLDVMGQYRSQWDDVITIDERLLVALTNGMALFERGLSGGKGTVLTARERGAYLGDEDRRAFVKWAATQSGALYANFFSKPGITAEMYSEWRADRAYAEMFWHLVLTEGHPDVDHETRELSRTLKDFIGRPKIKQDRFRNEVRKQWKRYVRTQQPVAAATALPFTTPEPVPTDGASV